MRKNQIHSESRSSGPSNTLAGLSNDSVLRSIFLSPSPSAAKSRGLVLAISLALSSVAHAESFKGSAMVTGNNTMITDAMPGVLLNSGSKANNTVPGVHPVDKEPASVFAQLLGNGLDFLTHTPVGWQAEAFGNNSSAFGYSSKALALNSISLAYNSTVAQSGSNGVALGSNSSVSGVNSVALGAGSVASQGGVVSVGGGDGVTGPAVRRIVNVGNAVDSHDAVNKSQLDGVASSVNGVVSSVNDVTASLKDITRVMQVTGTGVASASGDASTALGSDAQAVDESAAVGSPCQCKCCWFGCAGCGCSCASHQ